MTKENTELTDAEGLSHAAVPNQSSDSNGVRSPGSNQSDDPAVRKTMLTATTEDLEATANIHARVAVSQPMTASTSSSSNPSIKDAGPGTASPYGTRSRNRAGASRPNYAEDREMEMDFEAQPAPKEEDFRKVVRSGDLRSASVPECAAPTNIIRKAPGNQTDYNNSGHIMSKDHIPGTSTFSANPAANISTHHSKKRKATGQPAPANATAQLSNNSQSSGSQVTTRGASTLTQIGFRESNMLSFENCAGRLTDGKLVADDGTTLGLNGQLLLHVDL
jgi:hypothetical protein